MLHRNLHRSYDSSDFYILVYFFSIQTTIMETKKIQTSFSLNNLGLHLQITASK